METQQRRKHVLKLIEEAENPVSATQIAKETGVSRQAIVGDIALLRAEGANIVATARGYTMIHPNENVLFHGRIVSIHHTLEETLEELMTIVTMGGSVLDVIVDHAYYGELIGSLNLSTEADVKDFMEHQATLPNGLLSEITGGVHMHTIACKNRTLFDKIVSKLDNLGYIIK
jgi:transcriptional regulator of NAD metabolism